MGQPIFEPLITAPSAKAATEIFYCKGSGADGVGEYTTEGFVVHKGSKGREEIVPSFSGTSGHRLRTLLLTEGVLTMQGGAMLFTRDQLFASPSSASDVLTGRNSNGWTEWKAANGKTLDELKRQGVPTGD